MELREALEKRRSGRHYTEEKVAHADVEKIIEAGLLTPSSKNLRSTHFYVLEDPEKVHALAGCKPHFADMLKGAPCAIVTAGETASHAWVEDASAAMLAMMLEATELGLANCWVQVRHMFADEKNADGSPMTSNQYLHRLLHLPENQEVEAILALGHPAHPQHPRNPEECRPERVHWVK